MGQDIATLFQMHHRDLKRFLIRRVQSSEVAAELAQEAYLRLLRVPTMDRIKDLRGFLFTIASNLARDYLRQRARYGHVDSGPLDLSIPSPAPSVEARVDAQRHAALLQQAIDELPSKTRAVFVLYRVEGCSYRDIATVLDMSRQPSRPPARRCQARKSPASYSRTRASVARATT
jgi:RNA polymerase sigma factor (sigma-70 family)